MTRFEDLQHFGKAVAEFIGDDDGSRRWLDMSYGPKRGDAEVHLHADGEHSPVDVWTLATPELAALSAAIARKYRTDGHFRIIRNYSVMARAGITAAPVMIWSGWLPMRRRRSTGCRRTGSRCRQRRLLK